MKTQWIVIISILTIVLTGCATSRTPDLQSFQGPSLPTGGSDAAQVANTI